MEDAISVTLKKVTKRKDVPSICASGLSLRITRVAPRVSAGAVDFGILIRSDCAFVGFRFPAKQVRKE